MQVRQHVVANKQVKQANCKCDNVMSNVVANARAASHALVHVKKGLPPRVPSTPLIEYRDVKKLCYTLATLKLRPAARMT
jgi:hypothetical protein